jgi:type III pantothenate kinase
MILLVDVGNSRIKFVQQHGSNLTGYGVDVYNKSSLTQSLDRLWSRLPVPDQIWIANVGGDEVKRQLVRWTEQNWHKKPDFAVVEKELLGVTNAYTETNKLGIDRWLSLIAARHKYGEPSCIVSCGTAITIDGLDANGLHLGGLIMPGIRMMQESLYNSIPAIPYIENIKATAGLANSTEQAVMNGCMMAVVSLIEHAMRALQYMNGKEFNCLITGGDSESIMNLLETKSIYEPYLVFEGLALVAGNKP